MLERDHRPIWMSIAHERLVRDGLQAKGARPINPPKMNETVYLFALSVPALLEQLIAGQTGPRMPAVVPPRTEKRS